MSLKASVDKARAFIAAHSRSNAEADVESSEPVKSSGPVESSEPQSEWLPPGSKADSSSEESPPSAQEFLVAGDDLSAPPRHTARAAIELGGEPAVDRRAALAARIIRDYVTNNGATKATVAHLLTTFEMDEINPESAAMITAALNRANVEVDQSLDKLDRPDDQVVLTHKRNPSNL
jgi:hypothetical protein